MSKSHKDLNIYKLSYSLFIDTHRFTMCLPKHEFYELGSQLRRSSDSIVTNIVEGYGRKYYKADFIRFIIYAKASCDETICHLEKLKQLYPQFEETINSLIESNNELGSMIHSFIKYLVSNWRSPK
jgi:four helix bundle protein